VLKSLIAKLHNHFNVSAAEIGDHIRGEWRWGLVRVDGRAAR
jgi:uncharacterized protein YlxP (DUF503 family)